MSVNLIIVLHGYGSKAPNETALAVMRETGYYVKCPQLDHSNFYATKDTIDSVLLDSLRDPNYKDIVVVGSSMGGFWAHYCTKKYNVKTVLINPAVDIEAVLHNKGMSEEDISNYIKLAEKYDLKHYKTGTYVDMILGAKDDIINIEPLMKEFPSYHMLLDQGHRLQDFSEVIAAVNYAVNHLS